MTIERRGVAAIILCLLLAGCRAAADRDDAAERAPAAAPAGAASTGGPAGDASLVSLSPEARRQAGIATEVEHPQPFALTLSLLARLSPVAETPEEMEARLAFRAAEARDRRAQQELDRTRKLASDNVVAAKMVQAAEADVAQSRLERARAEAALRNLGLDGGHEPVEPTADLWALADLYGAQASQVTPGAAAFIRVESLPGEVFTGKVVSLARFLKPQTRTLTVRIAIRDPRHRLRPQDIAAAEIQVAEKTALSVPDAAVLYEGTERVLFVEGDGGFRKRRVQVGAQQGGRSEILAGLADGDTVVTRGAQFLLGEQYRIGNPGAAEDD